MYQKKMSEVVHDAIESAKEHSFEEGKKAVMRDIYWFMQTYKNDAGLCNRIEMYLSENDYN